MSSYLYHVQLNIDFHNKLFYTELFEYLGWSVIFEKEDVVGYKSRTCGDIWLVDSEKMELSDYDARGLNHIALRVDSIKDVDTFQAFLNKKGTETLFDTPKYRPEFASSDTDTYYQIMFKTADNILFEVVYIGRK